MANNKRNVQAGALDRKVERSRARVADLAVEVVALERRADYGDPGPVGGQLRDIWRALRHEADHYGFLVKSQTRGENMPELKPVYKGYTAAELKSAFDRVCDPADWKRPILARVTLTDEDLIVRSIEFFTGTDPTVTRAPSRFEVDVRSEGYRLGPAGP